MRMRRAASAWLSLIGARNSSRSTSPGGVGARLIRRMSMPASVVVLTNYLRRSAILEAERNPELIVHPNAVTA